MKVQNLSNKEKIILSSFKKSLEFFNFFQQLYFYGDFITSVQRKFPQEYWNSSLIIYFRIEEKR